MNMLTEEFQRNRKHLMVIQLFVQKIPNLYADNEHC